MLWEILKKKRAGVVQKETSQSLECANRWQYCCMCNKEWFRQERGSSMPPARGSRVQVTWLKASTLAEIQVGGHPPYSPDLSPCDYAISGPLKKALMGKRITSDDDVKQYVRNWFTMQPREFYETAIHRLVSQWDKCLNSQGQYFWQTGTGLFS